MLTDNSDLNNFINKITPYNSNVPQIKNAGASLLVYKNLTVDTHQPNRLSCTSLRHTVAKPDRTDRTLLCSFISIISESLLTGRGLLVHIETLNSFACCGSIMAPIAILTSLEGGG